MVRSGESATLAKSVRDDVRRAIIEGSFTPGERLHVARLAREYQVSGGVVREALIRLIEQSLVTHDSNRGFTVTAISPERLRDMTELRIIIEQVAAQWSIERGDLAWETSLIAAHHRLAATPRDDRSWRDAHREFHHALVAASGSPESIRLCARAFDWSDFAQHWAVPDESRRQELESDHSILLDAALNRDVPSMLSALRSHYEQTTTALLAHLSMTPAGSVQGATESSSQ